MRFLMSGHEHDNVGLIFGVLDFFLGRASRGSADSAGEEILSEIEFFQGEKLGDARHAPHTRPRPLHRPPRSPLRRPPQRLFQAFPRSPLSGFRVERVGASGSRVGEILRLTRRRGIGGFLRCEESDMGSDWIELEWLKDKGYYSVEAFVANRLEVALRLAWLNQSSGEGGPHSSSFCGGSEAESLEKAEAGSATEGSPHSSVGSPEEGSSESESVRDDRRRVQRWRRREGLAARGLCDVRIGNDGEEEKLGWGSLVEEEKREGFAVVKSDAIVFF